MDPLLCFYSLINFLKTGYEVGYCGGWSAGLSPARLTKLILVAVNGAPATITIETCEDPGDWTTAVGGAGLPGLLAVGVGLPPAAGFAMGTCGLQGIVLVDAQG